jgi:hypothetical protein
LCVVFNSSGGTCERTGGQRSQLNIIQHEEKAKSEMVATKEHLNKSDTNNIYDHIAMRSCVVGTDVFLAPSKDDSHATDALDSRMLVLRFITQPTTPLSGRICARNPRDVSRAVKRNSRYLETEECDVQGNRKR